MQLPTRWWGPRNWKSLATLDSWVLGVLAKLRQLILALEGQLRELEGQLKARVRVIIVTAAEDLQGVHVEVCIQDILHYHRRGRSAAFILELDQIRQRLIPMDQFLRTAAFGRDGAVVRIGRAVIFG